MENIVYMCQCKGHLFFNVLIVLWTRGLKKKGGGGGGGGTTG